MIEAFRVSFRPLPELTPGGLTLKVENFGLNSNIFNSLSHMNGNLHPLIFWKPMFR